MSEQQLQELAHSAATVLATLAQVATESSADDQHATPTDAASTLAATPAATPPTSPKAARAAFVSRSLFRSLSTDFRTVDSPNTPPDLPVDNAHDVPVL